MSNRKLIFGIIFVVGILISLTFVSAISGYSRSSARYTQPGMSSFDYMRGSDGGGINLYPILDEEKCGVGQDFIIQVAPEGCTPSVIRSDLLEEQNVPVFCPLMATKVNPLIDVEAIDHMSFRGDYPSEVSGVGFHPANAALKSSAREMLNSPVLENIGYAVIVLKKSNEGDLTNCEKDFGGDVCWVEGNMTATLRYDIKNAFGVGASQYNLPLIEEEKWDDEYRAYGFWKGKGYLRAESIDSDSARVSVFRDVDTRLSSKTLQVGETSDMIYIPGFYCLAGFQLRLDGLEAPDTRAKFEVDGDYFEAARGESFLDNKCEVRKLGKQGLVQEVEVRCGTDNGREDFKFEISPKMNLVIPGVDKTEFEVGDILYIDNSGRNVFLGFIGETKDTKFIVPVISEHTSKEQFLKSADRELIKNYVEYRLKERSTPGLTFIAGWQKIIGTSVDAWTRLIGGFVRGTDYGPFIEVGETEPVSFFSNEVKKVIEKSGKVLEFTLSKIIHIEEKDWDYLFDYDEDKWISFIGFVEPADKEINDDFQDYFNQAKQNYETLVNQFDDEKIDLTNNSAEGNTYAEKGLFELIELAESSGQMKTKVEMCNEFKEKYPKSDLDVGSFCDDELKNSNGGVSSIDVYINGRLNTISFKGIYEPSFEDYGADLRIEGNEINIDSKELTKNQIYYLNDGDYIQLKKVEDDSVEIDSSIQIKGSNKREVRPHTIKFGDDYANLGKGAYKISVNKINLNKEARVKVIPDIRNGETEADFNFKIGIEKRAIQLSPEKIASKIENLDEQIAKWTKISNTLDKTTKSMNKLCLGVGAALTIKNLWENAGGKALARQKVMRGENGDGGWMEHCRLEKENNPSISIDQCLYDKAPEIDAQVEKYAKTINSVNDDVKELYEFEDTLGGKIVNEDKFVEDYSKDIRNGLPSEIEGVDVERVKELLNITGWENSYFYKDDMKDIDLYSRLAKSGDEDAKESLGIILSRIEKTSGSFLEISSFADDLNVASSKVGFFEIGKNAEAVNYEGLKLSDVKTIFPNSQLSDDTPVYVAYGSNGKKYIMFLDGDLGDKLPIMQPEGSAKLIYDSQGNLVTDYPEELDSIYFQKYDASTYKNKFANAEIQYFETEPYKGFPGLVPFDLKNGWYAATRQSLQSGGNIRAFDESGKVASFYLCNVGENHKAEFHHGIKDDKCQGFNIMNGQIYGTFPGLDASKTKDLVQRAIRAITEAENGYKRGVKKVKITGADSVNVGGSVANIPEIQCQDFMSPIDCHTLFNVCDPVVCPSSRCDLGGNYPVEDVIQTGIIGGLTLCSQNWDGGKGVIFPVCLSGINAGVQGLLSMSESYRSCLNENLETGRTVGICDEIHSIYLCEFLWRQAMPFAKLGIPRVLEFITGQNQKGGGEYLSVSSAWQAAGDSVGYFKDYYGANAYKAFKYRSTADAGTDVCKVYVSGSVPVGGDFIDSLTEPASPVQYHARFDEILFTTATNPPISQYKVFYHIYAGKDIGAYYRVYLKGTEGAALYQDNPVLKIADGYVGVGGVATDTRDFTGAAGYKELCVSINAQEKCGFREISTSFAVDYVRDSYLAEQAGERDITKESECISGSQTAYSLLNPNLQEGLDEALNPDLYNRGIIRVCSTDSPGLGTDAQDGTKDAQWVSVGYCGDKDLQCWLDTSSVSEAISIDYLEEGALKKTTENYQEMLKGNYMDESEYKKLIEDLGKLEEQEEGDLKDSIVEINSNYDKVFLTNQKAALTYYLAKANKILAEKIHFSWFISTLSGQTGEYKQIYNEEGFYEQVWVPYGSEEKKDDVDREKEDEEDESEDEIEKEDGEITSGTFSEVYPQRYLKFKSIFENYAKDYPSELGEVEFKSLLVAIATQETSMGYENRCGKSGNEPCEDWLMGYTDGANYDEQFKGKDNQVKYASNTFKRAFEKNNVNYKECDSLKIRSAERIKCILKTYGPGTTGYDNTVYDLFLAWKEYFETGEFPEDVADELVEESGGGGDLEIIEDVNILIIKRFWWDEKTDSLELPVEEDVLLEVKRFDKDFTKNLRIKIDYLLELTNPDNGNVFDLEMNGRSGIKTSFVLPKNLFDNAKNGQSYSYKITATIGNYYDVYDGEIEIGRGDGEITQGEGGLTEAEIENIKSATECSDCGSGRNNICDEIECIAIGEEIGKDCGIENLDSIGISRFRCIQKSSGVSESFEEDEEKIEETGYEISKTQFNSKGYSPLFVEGKESQCLFLINTNHFNFRDNSYDVKNPTILVVYSYEYNQIEMNGVCTQFDNFETNFLCGGYGSIGEVKTFSTSVGGGQFYIYDSSERIVRDYSDYCENDLNEIVLELDDVAFTLQMDLV